MQYNYLIVSCIAKDYLAILATLALSKYVFSQGSNIVTKKRNRLTSDLARMIICLKA
jgi:glycine cleavage system regulatory protein